MPDPKPIVALRALNDANVDFIVVGGVPAVLNGAQAKRK